MMKLSLCIATFNEENNIHYPLDSAYDFVDEVIIVDGGSADKTVEKAKSYGKKVRVINSPNPPMFHINKQKALDAAKGEWILQLDADEEISTELKDEITSLIHGFTDNKSKVSGAMKQWDNVAYYLPRKNWFLTRFLMKGGQYPDYTIRLYRNGVVRFPLKSVHENVELISSKFKVKSSKIGNLNIENSLQIENSKLKIGFIQNPILHYADPDFSRYLKRWDRYTTLDANILVEKTKHWNNGTMKQLWLFFDYFVLKPKLTFLSMYFRHLGLKDGFPGFVFALFSSIRFWAVYIKYWCLKSASLS